MTAEKPGSYVKSHASVTQSGSTLKKYQQVIVGRVSFKSLLYYEFCMWLSGIPGALGLILRKKFWPRLFGSCGKGVLFASHIIVRHPHRIHLGDNVVISERCILDARTDDSEEVIIIGNNVILSNDVALTCKGGSVEIGQDVGIGTQTVIQSVNQCKVKIGRDCMLGPRCYFVSGGNYNTDKVDIPMRLQGIKTDSGIDVDEDVWFGANATVLGGVSIGRGTIVAAGAVVTKPMGDYVVCGGVPAKFIKSRHRKSES